MKVIFPASRFTGATPNLYFIRDGYKRCDEKIKGWALKIKECFSLEVSGEKCGNELQVQISGDEDYIKDSDIVDIDGVYDMAFERSQYPHNRPLISGMRPLVCAFFQSEVPQDEKSENGNCVKKFFLNISAKC